MGLSQNVNRSSPKNVTMSILKCEHYVHQISVHKFCDQNFLLYEYQIKIDVSNILNRKKAIEPPIVEVQKYVDVSSDDDDYDNNELNFNGANYSILVTRCYNMSFKNSIRSDLVGLLFSKKMKKYSILNHSSQNLRTIIVPVIDEP
ncbi:hypothetical protein BpHYR1_049544 [Brachionus plicatilis]|uniref:Uncharacterized protein n=1 Tax=Brachionus plicatilis TaxID=10195 RepID=A0A3M7SAP0_BRAPC|nr:hypothetical protein BpHYR1_049544 [Brachionus plicatilis]